MSTANEYQRMLGQEIEQLLGGGFKFLKSKRELRRKRQNGFDVIIITGSNKYSPDIDVSFYFGRNFDGARKIEKLLGKVPMPYHIQQYSLGGRSMKGLN